MRTDARLETLIARIGGAVVALSAALLFCFRWHASVSVHVYVWYVYTHARVNAIFLRVAQLNYLLAAALARCCMGMLNLAGIRARTLLGGIAKQCKSRCQVRNSIV